MKNSVESLLKKEKALGRTQLLYRFLLSPIILPSYKKSFSLFSLGIFVLLSSCSIQKRHYMDGYTIHLNKKSNVKQFKDSLTTIRETELNANLTASSEKEITPLPVKKLTLYSGAQQSLISKDSCDLIQLKGNKEIKAIIHEINSSIIKYKDCGEESGIEKTIDKNKVARITYKNGSTEQFELSSQTKPKELLSQNLPKQGKKAKSSVRKKAIISIVMACLEVFFLLLMAAIILWLRTPAITSLAIALALLLFALFCLSAALVLGVNSLATAWNAFKETNKNPEEQVHQKLAKRALLFSGVIASIILALLAFFALFYQAV